MRSFGLVTTLAAVVATAAFAAKPVMRVNGVEVTDRDLAMTERAIAAQMQQQGTQPQQDVLVRHSVDQLIGKALLLQAAREAKVTADPKEVAAGLDEQRKMLGGAENLTKALAQAGLTEADLTQMVTDQIVIQTFIEKVLGSRATPTDAEVKAYYDQHPSEFQHPEQVKLRMFFIQVKPGADQAAQDAGKTKAEAAQKRVAGGEDFAKVATEVSDDPSKAHGGDVGWARKGQLLADLETPVWALKSGEVSPVLKTQVGYFVFKMEDRRAAGPTSFEEAKVPLTAFVKNRKIEDSVRAVVKDQRAKAKIEALDPAVKTALEPPAPPAPAAHGAASGPGTPSGQAKPAAPPQASPAATPAPDAPKHP